MSIKGFSVGGNVERYDYNFLDNRPSEITVDTALSDSSTNPVQNSAVTNAINAANGSISSISGDVDDLKSAANDKAPVIINSASGAIASFTDGADGLPIKALTVNVEPIQDLHGYDNPWPAGGGKNLLENKLSTVTNNGVTFTVNADGSMILNGTASAVAKRHINPSLALKAGQYVLNGMATGGSSSTRMLYASDGSTIIARDTGGGATFTLNEDTTISVLCWVNNGQTVTNVAVKPMIRLASKSDATFAPYSNICPISGRTSATVTRTGKNLYDEENYPLSGVNKYIDSTDGKEKNNQGNLCVESFIPFAGLDGSEITLNKASGEWFAGVAFYSDANEASFISGARNNGTQAGTPFTFTVPSGTKYIRFTTTTTATDIQLELGSTASAYEPYAGNTYTIQLGETVYGGTLDVTGGKMVVDRAIVDLGTLGWIKDDNRIGNYYTSNITATPAPKMIGFAVACSQYAVNNLANANTIQNGEISSFNSYGQPRVFIKDIAKANLTVEQFTTAMSGAQLVYELATPIEITLTPTQIETLLGTNNIWSDAGDVSVDYRADTKLYIDNIHTPTDDDMTADAQIASGKYFIVGGNLYKSTTVIPAGDTIRPGTNCVKTNLAEALNALNA